VQLIIGGALDDGSEADLGARLGVSARHLRRMFADHLGVTPDQFARSRRAHFARRLLDDSDMSIAAVAFASGFGSIRQFNRVMGEVFRAAPRELRERRRQGDRLTADGGLALRMPFAAPYDWAATLEFLAERAVPGVESVNVAAGVYRRTIMLGGAAGLLEIELGASDHLLLRAHLPYWEGVIHVVERAARMVSVDSDPVAAMAHLSRDARIGPIVNAQPGVRVPGAWEPLEIALHAVISQSLPMAVTRAYLGNLARTCGTAIPGLGHGLTHAFPAADAVAGTDQGELGLAGQLANAVLNLATAVALGSVTLDGSETLSDLVGALLAVPGVSASAAQHIALRIGARDAFPVTDPIVADALGRFAAIDEDLEAISEPWRPWRALATVHLLHQRRSS
jgi:AraC family transcriptional regulator of adaptative response / DNA-3-methyladenine glycosylase II